MTEKPTGNRIPREIVVLPYDPCWPVEFEKIKIRLAGLLGEAVAEIEHIGSTSIPGMCAKPKIDVDIVLKSEELIPQGIKRLKQVDGVDSPT